MPYFSDHYNDLSYPTRTETGGLYNAQIGAIYALGAHFTIHEQTAVVTMPTGSGKTAVLMMSPYLLQATRVLVITPTRRRHRPRDVLGRLGRRHASSPHRRVYFGRAKDGS